MAGTKTIKKYRPPTHLIKLGFFVQRMHCIAYRYRIMTTQLLDTDTPFQAYRTSLLTYLLSQSSVVLSSTCHLPIHYMYICKAHELTSHTCVCSLTTPPPPPHTHAHTPTYTLRDRQTQIHCFVDERYCISKEV